MIVSIALYILASARGFASAANDQIELSAIESFNRYYQAFGHEITGIDALNIYNKAVDDTERHNHMHEVICDVRVSGLIDELKDADGAAEMTSKFYYSYEYDSDGYINKVIIYK